MPQLTLYHASPARSSVALWMLEEIGSPYDVKLLNLSKGDQEKPEYLAVNPMGKVPALTSAGDAVITKSAAICTYLADAFPRELGLPVGDTRRGVCPNGCFTLPACWSRR